MHLKQSTIFQCEINAIKKVVEWLHSHCVEKNMKEAVINPEALTIKALQFNVTTYSPVKDTVLSLDTTEQYIRVTINVMRPGFTKNV